MRFRLTWEGKAASTWWPKSIARNWSPNSKFTLQVRQSRKRAGLVVGLSNRRDIKIPTRAGIATAVAKAVSTAKSQLPVDAKAMSFTTSAARTPRIRPCRIVRWATLRTSARRPNELIRMKPLFITREGSDPGWSNRFNSTNIGGRPEDTTNAVSLQAMQSIVSAAKSDFPALNPKLFVAGAVPV